MKINWIDQNVLSAGGIPVSRENLESLKAQGIRAIVTLTEHPLDGQKSLPPELFSELKIELLHVAVVDQTPPTKQQVMDVYAYLNQMIDKEKPVFLHCHAGVGRTGTMLHAIELLRGMSLEASKTKIKLSRPTSQFIMLSDSQKAFLEALAQELS